MISSDSPIDNPEDDWLGVDPFAQAIARGIEKLTAPEGTVLAMTGAWGSGKSSAANLVLHHLKPAVTDGRLAVIQFNPWWYSSEELLTRGFFQHLYSGLGVAMSEKARNIILALSKKLLGSGPLISTAVNLFTLGLGGKAAEQAASFASDLIKTERTVEEEYKSLAEELENQQKRFLVVIDDIDRLTPDQTLLVFRLVKSVGRLPNVIYLLIFDRELAQRILAERYKSERHFLEKIVQADFEVPPPETSTLHNALLNVLVGLGGHPDGQEGVRFRNILSDVVYPSISLPRDLGRLINNLNVSWAAIGLEVNFADLVALESLKLFRLPVYQAIRRHKDLLCGSPSQGANRRDQAQLYDKLFLPADADDREREIIRTGLRRLFPRLDSVWSNVFHSSSAPSWRANRQICSPSIFSSYFKLSLGMDVLPRSALTGFLADSGDPTKLKERLRGHAAAIRKDGKSEIPILLDDLMGSLQNIPSEHVEILLGAILELADELDIERDEEAVAFGNGNQLRIFWLVSYLVDGRLPQAERSQIYRRLIPKASFEWALYVTRRLYTQHHPTSDEQQVHPSARHVEDVVASELKEIALNRLRKAASDGSLSRVRHLLPDLYSWLDLNDGNAAEIRMWTDSRMIDDSFVIRMASSLTSTVWRTSLGWDGMGDRVSQAIPMVRLDGHSKIIDVARFQSRLDEIDPTNLNEIDRQIVSRFREGVRNQENDRRRPDPPRPEDGATDPSLESHEQDSDSTETQE